MWWKPAPPYWAVRLICCELRGRWIFFAGTLCFALMIPNSSLQFVNRSSNWILSSSWGVQWTLLGAELMKALEVELPMTGNLYREQKMSSNMHLTHIYSCTSHTFFIFLPGRWWCPSTASWQCLISWSSDAEWRLPQEVYYKDCLRARLKVWKCILSKKQ